MCQDQVAAFVTDILNAGATLFAVDDHTYFFGDPIVAEGKAEQVWAQVNLISERYGPRDHLQSDIAAYLISLGKVINLDGKSHGCVG